jgi:hypothetical protein
MLAGYWQAGAPIVHTTYGVLRSRVPSGPDIGGAARSGVPNFALGDNGRTAGATTPNKTSEQLILWVAIFNFLKLQQNTGAAGNSNRSLKIIRLKQKRSKRSNLIIKP